MLTAATEKKSDIKLSDFGLAVFSPEGPQKFGRAGRAGYLAPEILEYNAYYTPADMWAAGVAMYTMLSATLPLTYTLGRRGRWRSTKSRTR